MRWLSTIKHADDGQARGRADGARRDRLPAADRRVRGARGRLARARARPGGRPVAARRRARHRGRRRRRAGRAGHDDRPRRASSPAATWCPPSARSPSASATASRPRAHIDAWLRGDAYEPPPAARAGRPSTRSTPGTTPTRRATVRPQLDVARRRVDLRRGRRRASTSPPRCSRPAAACPAATASSATTATASAPTTRSSSSSPGAVRYAIDLDYCKGCGICAAECPCGAIRDGTRGDLMTAPTATKWVYDFAEGSREMRDLLGGKGANIAEMTRVLGPERVPAGFTITTEACVAYMRAGAAPPDGLDEQVDEALARLEERAGKRLGDPDDPLLVSVRSGARDSMPGMMDTVLNLGLNDESVEGLAARTGNERFAWDSYRRLVQMFGDVVRGVPGGASRRRSRASSASAACTLDTELDARARCASSPRLPAGALRLPAGPARAARAGDPRRVRLLDGRPRGRVPAHQRHPRRLGHRGQRPADGVRQQGRRRRARASPSRATR